jgi:hypothetical protein
MELPLWGDPLELDVAGVPRPPPLPVEEDDTLAASTIPCNSRAPIDVVMFAWRSKSRALASAAANDAVLNPVSAI